MSIFTEYPPTPFTSSYELTASFNLYSGSISNIVTQLENGTSSYIFQPGNVNHSISSSVTITASYVTKVKQPKLNVKIISGSYTIQPLDGLICCNSTNSININLSQSSIYIGKEYTIKNKNIGTVIVSGSLYANPFYTYPLNLVQGDALTVNFDGINWIVI